MDESKHALVAAEDDEEKRKEEEEGEEEMEGLSRWKVSVQGTKGRDQS